MRCIVKDGKPGDAIVEAIGQYHPSVLVVGVKRTSETPVRMARHSRFWRGRACRCCAFRRCRVGVDGSGKPAYPCRPVEAVGEAVADCQTRKRSGRGMSTRFAEHLDSAFWGDLFSEWVPDMESGGSQVRRTRGIRKGKAGRETQMWISGSVLKQRGKGDLTMQSKASTERRDVAAPRPIAELLACPPAVANMLNASAECIEFDAGDVIFTKTSIPGLYVVIAGYMLRKAERMDTRLTLGTVRAGEVMELAAMLGDVRHTYTLVAQVQGYGDALAQRSPAARFPAISPAANAACWKS